MSEIRRAFKRAAETLLGSGAVSKLSGAWLRGRRLVLAYHNVLPPGVPPTGDRSLHCAFDQFVGHLDLLQARHELVALDDLLSSGSKQVAVSISFDDAYAGALLLAFPELVRRGIPVTVFVTPDLLGAGVPWWDMISPEQGLGDEVRRECLEELAGVSARVLEWTKHTGRPLSGAAEEARIATEAELITAGLMPGVTLAAHSWSHPNLVRSDDRELRAEMNRVGPWLEERFGARARNWVAYPYGLSDHRVREVARAVGYEAGFAISGGWHRIPADPFAIPRLNVPAGLSAKGLAARLNGLFDWP